MKAKVVYGLLGILVVGIISLPFFLRVKIECQSQYGTCPSEISDKLSGLGGKNLLQARSGAKNYLKNNLLVSDYSMQFKLPGVLLVSILVKKPEFAIMDKSTGKVGLVDAGGKIISTAKDSNLPTLIVANEDIKLGGMVSALEAFDLKIVRGVWEMYQVKTGEVRDDGLVVELPGSITVIFPETGDTDILLGALRLIYGKVESPDMAGKYSQIDLRFKNPVLR